MSSVDEIEISIEVAVEPDEAFAIFVDDIDAWWMRGPKYRASARPGTLVFEPGVDGRLCERYEDGTEHVVGRVTVWEPGVRLALEWRLENFAAHERTDVEINFEPTKRGTRVGVMHRGWTKLRSDHPARHGLQDGPLQALRSQWWASLLGAMKRHQKENPE